MSAFRAGAAVLGALALLSGCSSVTLRHPAPGGETVEAEGWAPLDSRDLIGSRSRALTEAQKRAVEKVAGVYVAASTKVEAAVAISLKISTEARGWIESFSVLDEKTEAGFVKVRIRAFVLRGEDLRAAAPSTPPSGTPRVEVRIAADDSSAPGQTAAALAALREGFARHGFALAADVLRGPGHEPLLSARAEVRAVPVHDARLGEFSSSRARVTVRVTDSRTGEIVIEEAGEASALDLDSEAAASAAAGGAGSAAGDSAAGELTAVLWKRF